MTADVVVHLAGGLGSVDAMADVPLRSDEAVAADLARIARERSWPIIRKVTLARALAAYAARHATACEGVAWRRARGLAA